ncbi:uncharacterized protein BP5553_00644 [Venustampulla echinocandica]|uniref:Sec39 domain-containing protein n=1 Tax=Venustampulla echinocandica TaxID=2656787 RepID=A0A370TYR6_9HELO|nr:uncharacterized protein BP5553_00644 [Venustampulla echinocandica]RDL40665.1 hypothetical protein BP5553_00644 [Venustampulla echinocandica]
MSISQSMAGSEVSPAQVILLAVQLASKADISALETLISHNRKTLPLELTLRILLTHLPESLESVTYVPFLERLYSGVLTSVPEFQIDKYVLDDLTDAEAKKKVRKLHLLPLTWPYDPADEPLGPLVRFLVLRSLRVDENTGLITQLPALLGPFLHHSTFLRTWLISSILPLLRFNYEYHPEDTLFLTIPAFEQLDVESGVNLLLSRTGINGNGNGTTVGRDLRGLVGPWMYGGNKRKRKNSRTSSQVGLQPIAALDEGQHANEKCAGWEEVFKWIIQQAGTAWETVVEVVEQWDGPGDVDLGVYGDGTVGFEESEQQHLERRYGRSAIAAAYLISDESVEALAGVHRILTRITTLLDQDRIPTLQTAISLLSPVSGLDEKILSKDNVVYLRNGLLDEHNCLTRPGETSARLLHALIISAYLCMRVGYNFTVRRAGELVLLQEQREQKVEFNKLMRQVSNGPKGDDRYWIKLRSEILWLRSWGAEELPEGAGDTVGRGVFGQLSKAYVEAEILKLFLSNNRYTLARSIYETSPDRPLSNELLVDTTIAAAMNAYDNATNANKTRGGVKKCNDILEAFPDTLEDSLDKDQVMSLINVTHWIGEYRLVFKQGEPFKPVTLRVYGDPISIIGKILDQNPKSYAKINNLVNIGKEMVKAGLILRESNGRARKPFDYERKEQLLIAEKRVVSMCIDAALADDDFETAYSYVVTRLKDIAGPSHSRSPALEKTQSGLMAEVPPKVVDDWSWRAALQAGKYRRNAATTKPTHFGNSSGNLEIRHLEQRMECLSQALRIAPKATLQEILNAYRRCEEELESLVQQEVEQEAAWDAQGDDQQVPGGFKSTPMKQNNTVSSTSRATGAAEEAPMSLFDLSRASMARAQSGFSALSMLKGNATLDMNETGHTNSEDAGGPTTPKHAVRKRDQLKNVAVGSLASGIGWLINAPPVNTNSDESEGH